MWFPNQISHISVWTISTFNRWSRCCWWILPTEFWELKKCGKMERFNWISSTQLPLNWIKDVLWNIQISFHTSGLVHSALQMLRVHRYIPPISHFLPAGLNRRETALCMSMWGALSQERRGLSYPGGASLACGGQTRTAGRLLLPIHASRKAAKAGVRSLWVAQWGNCKSLLQLVLFGFSSTPGVCKPTVPLGGQEAVIFFAVSINHHQRREDLDEKWKRKRAPPVGERKYSVDF